MMFEVVNGPQPIDVKVEVRISFPNQVSRPSSKLVVDDVAPKGSLDVDRTFGKCCLHWEEIANPVAASRERTVSM
jgi:hypothetical protein